MISIKVILTQKKTKKLRNIFPGLAILMWFLIELIFIKINKKSFNSTVNILAFLKASQVIA